jgi:predicted  nucleic acid-binding Zn-ribbon protein
MGAMPHYHCPSCGAAFHSDQRTLLELCACGQALDSYWMPAGPGESALRPEPGVLGAAKRRFRRRRRTTTPA